LGLYGLTALLAFAAAYAARLGPLFMLFGVLYALHLFRQAALVRMDNSPLALRLFKSNRTAGLILFVGFVAGLWRPG
jgi:4-hydroxybenzoate polyprenyltransferase